MPDIKFSCPQCSQHITCDEQWGGHELQCPNCQNTMMVPARPAAPPPPPRAVATGGSLVPAPPTSPAAKLSVGQGHGGGSAAQVPAQSRVVPVRNLAPPAPKKKNLVAQIATTAAVLVVLGAGGYFGYVWYIGRQATEGAADQDAAKKTDALEPGARPQRVVKRAGAQAPAAADSANGATDAAAPAAAPPATPPATPPVWTLEVAKAVIPEARAAGTISGTNFSAETARIDPVGTAQALRLLQGQAASPDREILIYLHLKPGEKLGGQTLTIAQDLKGSTVPQVAKRWKTDPKFAPKEQRYFSGYAMKLELGPLTNGTVAGKIFLALPDNEHSLVAGTFNAATPQTDPSLLVAPGTTPIAAPANDPTRAAYEKRYGVRR